jgi:hypothetical protein
VWWPSGSRPKGLIRQAKLLQDAHDQRPAGQQILKARMCPSTAPDAHHGAVGGDLGRQLLDLIQGPASLAQKLAASLVIDAELALDAAPKGHAGRAKLAGRSDAGRRRFEAGRRWTHQG